MFGDQRRTAKHSKLFHKLIKLGDVVVASRQTRAKVVDFAVVRRDEVELSRRRSRLESSEYSWEARIVSNRVPRRIKLKLSVIWTARRCGEER